MAITSTRHVESVVRGGAASIVRKIAWYPLQEVEQVPGRFTSTVKFKLLMKFWFITSILFSNTNNYRCNAGNAL